MVFDEAELATTLTTLQGKINTKQGDLHDANDIYRQLAQIQERFDGDGNPITLIDLGTGEEITTARKDEVYDKCKPLADAVT